MTDCAAAGVLAFSSSLSRWWQSCLRCSSLPHSRLLSNRPRRKRSAATRGFSFSLRFFLLPPLWLAGLAAHCSKDCRRGHLGGQGIKDGFEISFLAPSLVHSPWHL